MEIKKDYDFDGYATKFGLKCADGRTILKDAFKHQNGQRVPLVWAHLHNDSTNVLGHADLEYRDDGVYCYGKFNSTPTGQNAKALVAHGDISSLSIYANQLKEQGKQVMHGMIREVSLVVSGANPGAQIRNLSFAHGDGMETVDDTEAIIYSDFEFMHSYDDDADEEPEEDDIQHAESDMTPAEVFNTMTEDQKNVVYVMIAHALEARDATAEEGEMKQSGIENESPAEKQEDSMAHSTTNNEGENEMKNNVFDQSAQQDTRTTLTHDQMNSILQGAKKHGSLKESFLAHATEYGFDPIDILFPDAINVHPGGPLTIKRDDDWVSGVLNGCNKTRFSRIKTLFADLTEDEARAKGYITGNRKKEEIIPVMKRITTPTTVYKKNKLDRDDLVDITDFDVVAWLRREMREMLDEELARAILIGDGRDISDEDKINEQNLRPIATDDPDVFVHRAEVSEDETTDEIIDEFIRARTHYRGSGTPSLYTSTDLLTEMLLIKDLNGRRIYANVGELANVLRVSKIVEVEVMNNVTRDDGGVTYELLGIVVNLKDYNIGADKGGQVAMFDDFDIDYNQHKYLIETRVSGALIRPKAAIVMERKKS